MGSPYNPPHQTPFPSSSTSQPPEVPLLPGWGGRAPRECPPPARAPVTLRGPGRRKAGPDSAPRGEGRAGCLAPALCDAYLRGVGPTEHLLTPPAPSPPNVTGHLPTRAPPHPCPVKCEERRAPERARWGDGGYSTKRAKPPSLHSVSGKRLPRKRPEGEAGVLERGDRPPHLLPHRHPAHA